MATKKQPAARKAAAQKAPAKKAAPDKKAAPTKKAAATTMASVKKAAPRRLPTAPSARAQGKTVDTYAAALPAWQQDVIAALRKIILAAAPAAVESIKWGQPVYEADGPFAHIKAFTSTVNFGFWRGAEMADPLGVLDGGGDRMRYVRLAGTADIQAAPFTALVKEAVALNRAKGDPTRR